MYPHNRTYQVLDVVHALVWIVFGHCKYSGFEHIQYFGFKNHEEIVPLMAFGSVAQQLSLALIY